MLIHTPLAPLQGGLRLLELLGISIHVALLFIQLLTGDLRDPTFTGIGGSSAGGEFLVFLLSKRRVLTIYNRKM